MEASSGCPRSAQRPWLSIASAAASAARCSSRRLSSSSCSLCTKCYQQVLRAMCAQVCTGLMQYPLHPSCPAPLLLRLLRVAPLVACPVLPAPCTQDSLSSYSSLILDSTGLQIHRLWSPVPLRLRLLCAALLAACSGLHAVAVVHSRGHVTGACCACSGQDRTDCSFLVSV